MKIAQQRGTPAGAKLRAKAGAPSWERAPKKTAASPHPMGRGRGEGALLIHHSAFSRPLPFRTFPHLNFGFVSDFEFRISDLPPSGPWSWPFVTPCYGFVTGR
jgi:hypothetical protein